MYEPMNEAERREFLTQFIEKVEIYEEEQANGQWLKSIEFKLPIISKDMKISMDNGSQIETVCLLEITASPASELIKKMLESELICHIKGKGKGKYLFKRK